MTSEPTRGQGWSRPSDALPSVPPGDVDISADCTRCAQHFEATLSRRLIVALSFVGRQSQGAAWDRLTTVCPACLAQERADYQRALQETEDHLRRQRQEYLRGDWLAKSGLSGRYLRTTFGTFRPDGLPRNLLVVRDRCAAWAEAFPVSREGLPGTRSLVLWGAQQGETKGLGTGKTHLAAAVVHRVIERWAGGSDAPPALFTTAPDALMALSNSRRFVRGEHEPRETEQDVYDRLSSVPLLVLDDVGKERERYDQQEFYYKVLNARYSYELPIVITANLPPSRLAEALGDAAVSRLQSMARDTFLDCRGPDYRARGETA